MITDINGNEMTIEEARKYMREGMPEPENYPLPSFHIDDLGQILRTDFKDKADGKTPIYFMFAQDGIYISFSPFTLEMAQESLKDFMENF